MELPAWACGKPRKKDGQPCLNTRACRYHREECTPEEQAAFREELRALIHDLDNPPTVVRANERATPELPACYSWPQPERPITTAMQFERWHGSPIPHCAFCATPSQDLVEDHCHRSGLVRGLLCQSCNTREGFGGGPAFDVYRALPPAVILNYAEPYRTWGRPALPELWVLQALGPVPRDPAEAASYLRRAALLSEPSVGWGKDNALYGIGL